ncbi:MAG: hypothetical protein PF637_07290 [Spirochaetes bacterium]|jgi:hypothetical protein|nr:hypothetical protein [Spirochaetota bacterium]
MKKQYTIIIFLMLLTFAGCFSAQLREGTNVDYVTKQEAPSDCKKIGEVELDLSKLEGAVSASDVIVKLRNKTGQIGGDFLVVDAIEAHRDNSGRYYSGFGRAYKCK